MFTHVTLWKWIPVDEELSRIGVVHRRSGNVIIASMGTAKPPDF